MVSESGFLGVFLAAFSAAHKQPFLLRVPRLSSMAEVMEPAC